MRHAIAAMLHTDTIDRIELMARSLSKQRQCKVSASEVIEYLVADHWRKQMKKKFIKKGNNAVMQRQQELR